MTAVLSVEHFTLTISDDDRTDTTANIGDLGESQDITNCIPFVTSRVSDVTGMGRNISHMQADVYFATSPDRVIAERDNIEGELIVEVAVVEFDPAVVNVYSDAWTLAGGSGDTLETVDLSAHSENPTIVIANTFLVNHSYQNSAGVAWGTHLFRSRITGTQELQFQRGSSSGTADGHWYLAEATDGDFTVAPSDIQFTTTSGTDTISTVTLGSTFLLGSHMISTDNDNNDENTIDVGLTADDTVTATRGFAAGTIDWTGFVVKMADGTSVERGTIDPTDGSDDVTVSSVTVANSMAVIAGNYGSTFGGTFTGISTNDQGDAHTGITFVGSPTSTTIRAEHDITGGETGVVSWEVIEWDTGGAPPAARRVMVIS